MENGKQQPLLSGDTCRNDYANVQQSPPPALSLHVNGDVQINGVNDFCREFYDESKRLWYLAGPAIFTSLCQYTIGATTQLFAGQLGTIQLATVSVENTVIAGFSYSILVCICIYIITCKLCNSYVIVDQIACKKIITTYISVPFNYSIKSS